MQNESAAPDLERRPRIQTATILPARRTLDETDTGTDVETLLNTVETPRLREVSLVPIAVTDDDIVPFDEDVDDAYDEDDPSFDATLQNQEVVVRVRPSETESAVFVHGARPGGYHLLKSLDAFDSGELFIAEKPMYFGIPRRGYLKRLSRHAVGYTEKRRALLHDARIGAAFNHPNLVAVTHAGEDDDGCHVAFEHVEGTNLARVNRAMRQRGEAMPFEIVAWIVAEVLRGLHHVHELRLDRNASRQGVVGELCPANILVSRTGQVKLATFALRMAEEGDFEIVAKMTERAAAYLAPECLTQSEWTVRSDVYAIGLALFELLSGRECFPDAGSDHIYLKTLADGLPLHVLSDEDVPVGLQQIVARATNRMPGQRFQSAMSMATALNTWIHESGRHAMPSLVSRFLERHDLYEGSDVAYGATGLALESLSRLPPERPEGERSMRACVADLFPADTQEEISLDSALPSDTLSAMIIREELDPEAIASRPAADSIMHLPPRLPTPTNAPRVESAVTVEPDPTAPPHYEISALHRIRRGPNWMTIGLLLGAALLFGAVISVSVSLATDAAPKPKLTGER